MKKLVFGIFISVLMITSVLAGATINYNEVKPSEVENLFDIKDGTISAMVSFDDYKIEKTEKGDEITIEKIGRLLIPGKPDVPSKIFSIAIPPGADYVDLSYSIMEEVVLPGVYDVPPVDLPRVIGEEKKEIYLQDLERYDINYKSVYENDDFYPSQVAEYVKTAGYRKYNLVDVRVNPFAYNPISGTLIFYSNILIDVSYSFPLDFSYDKIMIDNIPKAENFAGKTIYNYDQAKNWYPTDSPIRETYDYVIITLDSLESYVQDLVDWEEGKGRSVYVATTDWIDSNYNGYDLAEKMRNFLRDKYPSDEWGILDVCLIGDYDDVPMRRCAQSTGYGQPRTDYYYAELSLPDSESWDANGNHQYGENSDPIDFHSEVNVGRIPWSDPLVVDNICEKSADYEQNNNPSFKKNILLIGTFFWPDTDNAVLMEAKVDQEWMTDWTMTRMYEDAQSNYECDYDVSYAAVKNVWSEGSYAFVDWAGHGSPTACYEYYPSQAFVDTATCSDLNDNYPAIIFADACSNSDTDYDNIGQMMMKQGAVGFLGATEVAYGKPGWSQPYSGSSQSFDYFFTTCCTSGEYTQGEAQQWALLEMYTNNLWYYPYYETFQWGALWGNPDLQMGVVSRPPETPDNPKGPTTWTIDIKATYESTTTDPDGDSIFYLFDWGDGSYSDWVGPYVSGQKGSASHVWTELGDYEVKVKARDMYGVQSNWSDPLHVSVVPNDPPTKPTITGPKSGAQSKLLNFKFTATDPENQELYYWIAWGGDVYPETYGPYSSGEEVTISHSWGSIGDYTINAKTLDEYGSKSGLVTYTITITKNRATASPGFMNLIQSIIDHFPVLKFLL
jgi:hypothetical protein